MRLVFCLVMLVAIWPSIWTNIALNLTADHSNWSVSFVCLYVCLAVCLSVSSYRSVSLWLTACLFFCVFISVPALYFVNIKLHRGTSFFLTGRVCLTSKNFYAKTLVYLLLWHNVKVINASASIRLISRTDLRVTCVLLIHRFKGTRACNMNWLMGLSVYVVRLDHRPLALLV